MKEKAFIKFYMSKPIQNSNGQWTAYTSNQGGDGYPYMFQVAVPEEMLAEELETVIPTKL